MTEKEFVDSYVKGFYYTFSTEMIFIGNKLYYLPKNKTQYLPFYVEGKYVRIAHT